MISTCCIIPGSRTPPLTQLIRTLSPSISYQGMVNNNEVEELSTCQVCNQLTVEEHNSLACECPRSVIHCLQNICHCLEYILDPFIIDRKAVGHKRKDSKYHIVMNKFTEDRWSMVIPKQCNPSASGLVNVPCLDPLS